VDTRGVGGWATILYAVYAAFVIWGFVVWLRISRATPAARPDTPSIEVVA
jgi:nicotinamide mononucleotide transporter